MNEKQPNPGKSQQSANTKLGQQKREINRRQEGLSDYIKGCSHGKETQI